MIWTILILLSLFVGLKLAITWLIKNRSASLASWAIFWIVFIFSGFLILFAKIQKGEAERMTIFAMQAQQEAQANAEEALRQMEAAKAAIALAEAQRQVEIAEECRSSK